MSGRCDGCDALRERAEEAERELADVEQQCDRLHAMFSAKAPRALLVAALGQELYNTLWGPYLEWIGEAIDIALSRADAARARAELAEARLADPVWQKLDDLAKGLYGFGEKSYDDMVKPAELAEAALASCDSNH